MFINYERLYESGLSDADFHTLVKVQYKKPELLTEQAINILEEKGLVKFVKSPKDRLKAVRLSDRGKELLGSLTLIPNNEVVELAEKLVELYETYGVETGNKREVLSNLAWFVEKGGFETEDILPAVEEWLTKGYKVWLVNLLWDKKRANVFTTQASKQLQQSPLYEFMRRLHGLKW